MTKARGYGRGTSKRALINDPGTANGACDQTKNTPFSVSINQPSSNNTNIVTSQNISLPHNADVSQLKSLTRGRGRSKLCKKLSESPSLNEPECSNDDAMNHLNVNGKEIYKDNLFHDKDKFENRSQTKFKDDFRVTDIVSISSVQKDVTLNSYNGTYSTCSNPKNRTLGRSKFSNHSIISTNNAMERTESPRAKLNRPSGGEKCFNFSYKEPDAQVTSVPQPIALQSLGDGKHILNPLSDGMVSYNSKFYEKPKADKLLHMLLNSLNFEAHSKKRGDDIIQQPRLCIWFAPKDMPYSYSYVTLEAHEFISNSIMSSIKTDVEQYYNCTFNSCLVNLYRDNKDSVGWHADDEKSLGSKPTIASISFGETRRFEFCRKDDNLRKPVFGFNLEHGSGLLMKGDVQEKWLHCVPKEYHDRKHRLNLTFRTIYKTR